MTICTRLLLFVLGCPETKSDPNTSRLADICKEISTFLQNYGGLSYAADGKLAFNLVNKLNRSVK